MEVPAFSLNWRYVLSCCSFCYAAFFAATLVSAAPNWGPINKEELTDSTPHIAPEADVEILSQDAVLDHSSDTGTEDRYYIRAKIYTQRGVEFFSLLPIPYLNDTTEITGIAARTIKPDGTVVELNPKDVRDREEMKAGEIRVRTKTFAFPGVEPGAVVEYRYTRSSNKPNAYVPLIFQGKFPARSVKFHVRMLQLPPNLPIQINLRVIWYNCPQPELKEDRNGYYNFEMTNLTAVKEEPLGRPKVDTHSSIIMYYTSATSVPAKEFWNTYSKELHKELEKRAKVTKSIKVAFGGMSAPEDSAEEKLRKLYDFCRTKIINRNRSTTHFTREQLKKLEKNDTASDTLESGNGSGLDVDFLFAALARAAGFDVRLAACNDRQEITFKPAIIEPSIMLPHRAIAVRLGDSWRYFDPGASYLPFGTLNWRHCDTALLMSDPKGGSPLQFLRGDPSETNLRQRKATFQLRADGSLDGDVVETYTGQCEVSLKYQLDNRTPDKKLLFIRNRIRAHQAQARVRSVVVENADNPLAPLKISYHLNISAYADRTGTRLFFQPAVFEKGTTPLFVDSERHDDIIFPYRFVENEEIHITLPAGYTLEAGSAPAGLDVPNFGKYEVTITVNKKTNELTYKRSLSLKEVSFKPVAYASIKTVYDQVHTQDAHTLALKHEGSESVVDQPAPAPAPAEEPMTGSEANGDQAPSEDGKEK